jgi:hypothetical protein
VHDFDAHVFKVMLSNTAPNLATNNIRADAAEIAAANGYVSGGNTTTITVSRTGGTAKATATDVPFTASGGNINTFRYVIVYNDSATSPAGVDPLICVFDFGSAVNITNGNTFTVDFDAAGGLFTIT